MSTKEKIKVYIDFQNGHVACICKEDKKKCKKKCTLDVVERDKYAGWEDTFQRNRYGR